MKGMFWKIIGASVITTIVVNGVVNTVSRIRRDRLEDEDYAEEIQRKKEERLAKKLAKQAGKNSSEVAK